MISTRIILRGLCVLALVLATSGCLPSASDPLEEQREPHFLTGKSRVNAMDYEGAVEAFEKALEANPHSSSAHFELGLLYEDRVQDYAAAIYHFDRYLKLRPTSDYAEIVKQRVVACKQELAKTVSLAPLQQNMQRDLERLADENRDLRQKLEAWQAYYNGHSTRLPDTSTPAAGNPAPLPPPPRLAATVPTPAPPQPSQPKPVTLSQPSQPTPPAPNPTRPIRAPARAIGTHTVKSGDTPANIARKYGVKLDALLAANPGMDPKRLKIGQTLTVPAP